MLFEIYEELSESARAEIRNRTAQAAMRCLSDLQGINYVCSGDLSQSDHMVRCANAFRRMVRSEHRRRA